MNTIDLLLAAVLVLFALRGLWRGFFREAFGLAGILAGAVAAATWSTRLGEMIAPQLGVRGGTADLIAGAAIFLGVVLVASLAGRLARRLARALWLGPVDSGLGVVFGIAKGAAVVGLGLLALQRLAPGSSVSQLSQRSVLARPLVDLAGWLVEVVRPYSPPVVRAS